MTMTFDGSTGITFPDGQTQTAGIPAPGASGNVVTSNGTVWISTAPSSNGANLSSINASNLTSGTVATARLPTVPVASGGTGQTSLTANNVILGNATAAVQFVAPGSTGNVLTSNGTTWVSQAAAAFDAGTRMIFAQTSAPTGWTKDTTNYNNHALRVVTGTASTGGSVGFTTAFASQSVTGSVASTGSSTVSGTSDATTLSTSQIPSHQHTIAAYTDNATQGPRPRATNNTAVQGTPTTDPCGSTGGGGSHTHTFTSGGHTHTSGAFTGNSINLAVQYLDVITATKN